jgi:hypothetical protein
MKKRALLLALLMALSGPAAADTFPEFNEEMCKILVAHQPAADVEYKPSVDINGKPVVEADLNKPNVQLPEALEFEMTIDAAQYTGLKMQQGSEAKASLGTIGMEEDGALTFNGESLTGEAESALRAFCAEKGHFIQEKQLNLELQKP